MATETFHTLIAKNRRNSIILIGGFMLFFIGMGLLIGMVWGGGQAAFSITVAAIAGLIAFGLTLASYFGGSSVLLGMSKAKEIVHADDPQLFNVVEEICLAGGMPLPRIYLINDTAMNAFATGRNPQNASVAITIGLRTKLNRDELQGVMAHELSHIRNYDILYAMLMAVMVGVLVMLCDIFLRSVFWGGAGRRRSRDRNGNGKGGLQAILMVLAVLLAIIAPILARIIQMSLSRQREYLADAGSVELTRNPEGLIGALNKLGGDSEVLEVANRATAGLYFVHPIKKFEKRASSIFCTHPPIDERVARLQQLSV
ncbi:MAG: M48 family metallopeptidase [Phycisphaerae bacterium]|jgi:heat shock protein HtpX|nr:M48 family metallopeptidase [Phycisphaerae bacterium]